MKPTRQPVDRRRMLGWLGAVLAGAVALPRNARATAELISLRAQRVDGALALEFATRVSLPRAVEDALQRGVPIYFVAQATLLRYRWYWRDERVARVGRTWRLAYQPLTGNWRVGLGGLNQTHATLAEAMAVVTRIANWRLVDLSQLDPDSRYTVDFKWQLDTSQLPSPMLIDLVGGSEFSLGVERSLRVE